MWMLGRYFSFEKQMLYVLCLPYLYNTEIILFSCLSSGWATTTGSLLVPKMRNSISVFPKDTTTRYRIGSRTKVSQPFDY